MGWSEALIYSWSEVVNPHKSNSSLSNVSWFMVYASTSWSIFVLWISRIFEYMFLGLHDQMTSHVCLIRWFHQIWPDTVAVALTAWQVWSMWFVWSIWLGQGAFPHRSQFDQYSLVWSICVYLHYAVQSIPIDDCQQVSQQVPVWSINVE